MCGIAGVIRFDNLLSAQYFQKMTDIIDYRGPDDEGFYLFNKDQELILGGKSIIHIRHPYDPPCFFLSCFVSTKLQECSEFETEYQKQRNRGKSVNKLKLLSDFPLFTTSINPTFLF